MTKIKNDAALIGDEKTDILRSAVEHRATWMGLTFMEAKEAGKEEEGEAFARGAITKTGLIQGAGIKEKYGDGPMNCAEFGKLFLSETMRKNFEMTFEEESEDKLDIRFHYCPLLKAWQKLGYDDDTCAKLCDIAMDGDRNIAKAMGLDFHLGNTIAQGYETCEICFSKKKD